MWVQGTTYYIQMHMPGEYDGLIQWRRNYGDGGTLCPPSSGPVPPSQRRGLRQNFKQTTLTTRLYKVLTNLYPPLTKTFRSAWIDLCGSSNMAGQ